jgi:hypothetical protein
MVNGVIGWIFGSGVGGSGHGWIMVQWSWKVRCDGKNIFGLDGQEVFQQVKMPLAAHFVFYWQGGVCKHGWKSLGGIVVLCV